MFVADRDCLLEATEIHKAVEAGDAIPSQCKTLAKPAVQALQIYSYGVYTRTYFA